MMRRPASDVPERRFGPNDSDAFPSFSVLSSREPSSVRPRPLRRLVVTLTGCGCAAVAYRELPSLFPNFLPL